jgi:hypothetical protein
MASSFSTIGPPALSGRAEGRGCGSGRARRARPEGVRSSDGLRARGDPGGGPRELRLIVHPIVVGEGGRLFDGSSKVPLILTETKPIDSGIVILVYGPAEG